MRWTFRQRSERTTHTKCVAAASAAMPPVGIDHEQAATRTSRMTKPVAGSPGAMRTEAGTAQAFKGRTPRFAGRSRAERREGEVDHTGAEVRTEATSGRPGVR